MVTTTQWIFTLWVVLLTSWWWVFLHIITMSSWRSVLVPAISLLSLSLGWLKAICIVGWKVLIKLKGSSGLKLLSGKKLQRKSIKCPLSFMYLRIILGRSLRIKLLIPRYKISKNLISCLSASFILVSRKLGLHSFMEGKRKSLKRLVTHCRKKRDSVSKIHPINTIIAAKAHSQKIPNTHQNPLPKIEMSSRKIPF